METSQTNKPQTETKPEQRTKGCSCFSTCFDAGRANKSKIFIAGAVILGIIILMLGSFAGGVFVGFHKAKFSCDWEKNYERNFMGSKRGGLISPMMRKFEGRDFRNAHGLAGTIISIMDNNIIVKDKDGKENTVAVTDKTLIKSRRDNLKLSDLKTDDQVVVMGSPDENGVVSASLIRVFNGN